MDGTTAHWREGLQVIVYSEGQHYFSRLYLPQCLAHEVKQPLCSVLLQMSCEYVTRTNTSHDYFSSPERNTLKTKPFYRNKVSL